VVPETERTGATVSLVAVAAGEQALHPRRRDASAVVGADQHWNARGVQMMSDSVNDDLFIVGRWSSPSVLLPLGDSQLEGVTVGRESRQFIVVYIADLKARHAGAIRLVGSIDAVLQQFAHNRFGIPVEMGQRRMREAVQGVRLREVQVSAVDILRES